MTRKLASRMMKVGMEELARMVSARLLTPNETSEPAPMKRQSEVRCSMRGSYTFW